MLNVSWLCGTQLYNYGSFSCAVCSATKYVYVIETTTNKKKTATKTATAAAKRKNCMLDLVGRHAESRKKSQIIFRVHCNIFWMQNGNKNICGETTARKK